MSCRFLCADMGLCDLFFNINGEEFWPEGCNPDGECIKSNECPDFEDEHFCHLCGVNISESECNCKITYKGEETCSRLRG